MTTTTKWIVAAIAVLVIIGAYYYPKSSNTVIEQQVAGSAAGSTFNTAKFAGIAVAPATPGTNATSSSILNGDAGDRYVTQIRLGCESVGTSKVAYTGGGLASNGFTLSVATSSTAAPATNSNTNIVGGNVINISTSTQYFVEASSTALTAVPNTGSSAVNNIWLSGSYMTFTFNATNTAVCTAGVDYVAS